MKIKIFWQPECVKCPEAKELGKKLADKGQKVELKNIKESDGLADAAYHNIMATPSVVLCDDEECEIKVWLAETPKLEEVMEVIK
ncbi:MAG: thioredoxin family protein [Candidatus Nanoarchaeia archaeon]|nr:thioredoxin family protein [Candidatus Nanoarchaeia archaeon]